MEDLNIIDLSGIVSSEIKLSHKNYGLNFYSCNIDVMRSSGVYDVIPLIIPSSILDCNMVELKGKYVSVFGQIRTRNNDGHLMVTMYVQEIDVLEINTKDIIDINEVELKGHICKKSELRDTPLNRTICDFILSINRGNNRTDYIPIVSWGNTAKKVDNYKIGEFITVKGRFQSRIYGNNHVTYEVSAKTIELGD